MALNIFSDVTVDLQASAPSVTIGLGVPAIFVKASGSNPTANVTKYYDLPTLVSKYTNGTDVANAATAIFSQQYRPDHIDVIEYIELSAGVEQFFNEDWTFALLATPTVEDSTTLSMAIDQHGYKFAVVQVEKASDIATIGAQNWTIATVLPKANGRLDAALVGNVASRQVGSVNWKFRSLTGVKPYDDVSQVEYSAIEVANGITYNTRGSVATTSLGKTLSGSFIDDLHGRIWIKTNVKTKLQDFLNKNDKVPYNTMGINLLLGELSNVLSTAWQNGIIETGDDTKGEYTTAAVPRSGQDEADVQKRVYKGLSFTYTPATSIDKLAVSGTVILP